MKRKLGIFLTLVALVASSCSDFLDVNKDPNNAGTSTPALALPAGVASAAATIGTYYNILGGMWVQYWTQNNGSNQYKNFDAYNIQQSMLNPDFNELYSGSLKDLQFAREKSKETGDWNLYLMSTVMQSYVFQMLADTYDQIPFDEALQGDVIQHAHFRPGQQVYDSLIKRIDDALAKDFDATTNTDPGTADLLFGGDVSQWVRFANTLKLKIYLRQIYARPDVAEDGIEALYADGAEFLTTSATMSQFTDAENKSNPLYESDQRKLNTNQNIKASKTFMDWLVTNKDTLRADKLFIDGTSGRLGLEQGNFGAPTTEVNPASISRARIGATDTSYFLSQAESFFLQAEAAARGLGDGDAEELFYKGLDAAYARFDLDNPDIYDYPNGTEEENLEAIAVQKWAALAGIEGLEAFLERNRLGYPKHSEETSYESPDYELGDLMYPVGGSSGVGNFPRRLLFPETERTRNPNTPPEVPFTTKVWWDQKPE